MSRPIQVGITAFAHGLAVDELEELHRQSVAAKELAYCPYSKFRVGAAVLLQNPPAASASTSTGTGTSTSTSTSTNISATATAGDGAARDAARYVLGANIENASYPVGTCAERVALGRALMDGHRAFKAVAVATDTAEPSSPCGMCRQL